jgi:hypothetical protein
LSAVEDALAERERLIVAGELVSLEDLPPEARALVEEG